MMNFESEMTATTSYRELSRILQDALGSSRFIRGVQSTARDEVLVELVTGETFMLSPMFLPPSEVDRLALRSSQ